MVGISLLALGSKWVSPARKLVFPGESPPLNGGCKGMWIGGEIKNIEKNRRWERPKIIKL